MSLHGKGNPDKRDNESVSARALIERLTEETHKGHLLWNTTVLNNVVVAVDQGSGHSYAIHDGGLRVTDMHRRLVPELSANKEDPTLQESLELLYKAASEAATPLWGYDRPAASSQTGTQRLAAKLGAPGRKARINQGRVL